MGWGTVIFGKDNSYRRNLWIAFDQGINAIFGGNPDETISSRLGRLLSGGNRFARAACKVLDALDPKHCEASVEFTEDGKPDPHHLK